MRSCGTPGADCIPHCGPSGHQTPGAVAKLDLPPDNDIRLRNVDLRPTLYYSVLQSEAGPTYEAKAAYV